MPRLGINFFANPSSIHVQQWEKILDYANIDLMVYGVAKTAVKGETVKRFKNFEFGPLRYFPISVNYIFAGLRWRFLSYRKSDVHFVHAHNASGYGTMAWLSGRRYGVTTYGTEIFCASKSSIIYRWLLKKVLLNAEFVTATSSAMSNCLVDEFNVDRDKIHEFSLGVSEVFSYSSDARKKLRDDLGINDVDVVWIANRRVHPHYQTIELIAAFDSYARQNPDGVLLLLEGDSDFEYLSQVKEKISSNKRVILIEGIISQVRLSALLSASDYAISIPFSDQLSSSILEAAKCRAIPVLINIDSYDILKDAALFIERKSNSIVSELESFFISSSNISSCERRRLADIAEKYVAENFSLKSAAMRVVRLYMQCDSLRAAIDGGDV